MNKKITKDFLYQKYIIENKSQKDIAEIFGCTRKNIGYYLKKFNIKKSQNKINKSIKDKFLEKYGVEHISKDNDIRKKIEKTNLEKYGYKNPAKNKKVKEKIAKTNNKKYSFKTPLLNKKIKEKTIKTNLKKYGFEHHFSNSKVKEKIKNTIIDKYGVNSLIKSQSIKEKIEKTNLKRYGYKNPAKNKKVKEKIKKTNLNKYGVSCFLQTKESRKKLEEALLKKYGVESLFGTSTFKSIQAFNGKISILHGKTPNEWALEYGLPPTNLYKWLESHPFPSKELLMNYLNNYKENITDIEHLVKNAFDIEKFNKKIDPNLKYRPDFKLTDNIALNVDGLYWHSELHKDKWYHFHMREDYDNANLRIIQFRANELYQKLPIITSMINNVAYKTSKRIGARKTKIIKVDNKTAKNFLEHNHLKGAKTARHIGLVYNDELIQLLSYKIFKSGLVKISRFCSKVNHVIIGGFSKLLNYLFSKINNLDIHYWVDLRYGTGKFLLNHGFKVEKETLGWEWTDFKNTYNRLQCRANMDERGLSQKEYAEELGWYKIYDAGQRLYIKK